MALTAENRANLKKLATYLDTLPRGWEHFAMSDFYLGKGGKEYTKGRRRLECGAVACAIGHGPLAGIPFPPNYFFPSGEPDWLAYSDLFASDEDGFLWAFAGAWNSVDNTPHGAAARIRYLLELGQPADFAVPSIHWVRLYEPFLASVDTHPKGGDANAAPFMSGAVGAEGDETPNPERDQ